MLAGTLKDWKETEPGRWEREPGDGIVFFTPSEKAQTFADYFAYRADPPPPEPDPRAEIADLKAAMAALKKSGVLTDRMIDAERVALTRKE